MCGLSDPSGGGAAGCGNGVVMMKSVSAPLMLSSPLVSNHTPNPPLLPPPSPSNPIFAPPYPSDAQLAPPSPPWWIIHASSKDSPGSSQTRSQGRTMKSPVMAAWISGCRRISAVGVFWESEEGARRSGLGRGRDVRCGFWARAVVMAAADEGAVMSLMSFCFLLVLGLWWLWENQNS